MKLEALRRDRTVAHRGQEGRGPAGGVQEFDKNHVPTTRKCPKTVRVYTLVYTFMGRKVRK